VGNTALVLGNGESRRSVNLNQFNYNVLLGCNAVHRDISVDYIVCGDKRTVEEAVQSNVKNIYTRPEWAEKFNVNTLPELPYVGSDRIDQPKHWGSGAYAVLLATTMADKIMLLGFDLYGIDTYRHNNSLTVRQLKTPQVNNIYKGTRNYSSTDTEAVDYSYWIYQLGKIFECFPNIEFTIINKPEWKMPDEWQKNNVEFLAL
jgi:hypothetical protein